MSETPSKMATITIHRTFLYWPKQLYFKSESVQINMGLFNICCGFISPANVTIFADTDYIHVYTAYLTKTVLY